MSSRPGAIGVAFTAFAVNVCYSVCFASLAPYLEELQHIDHTSSALGALPDCQFW